MAKCYRKLAGHWHVEGEGEGEAELQAGRQAGRLAGCSPLHMRTRTRNASGEGSCHLVEQTHSMTLGRAGGGNSLTDRSRPLGGGNEEQ